MTRFLVTDDGYIMEKRPDGGLEATGLVVEQAPLNEAAAGLWFIRHMIDEPPDWAETGYGTREAAVTAALAGLLGRRPSGQ
jgi:hypothetical protein